MSISGHRSEYTYTRARNAAGISYHVEWSDSLAPGSWSEDQVRQTVAEPDTDPNTHDIKATAPIGGSARRFLRLRVVHP